MPRLQFICSLALLAVICVPLRAQEPTKDPAVDPEYVKVTNERADKIVATLGIENADDSLRVRDLVAGWYRTLSAIHDARDKKELAADKASEQQLVAHRRFIAMLEVQLTPEQVEKV